MPAHELLTFIHFNHFSAEWKRLKLTDEDLRSLELDLLAEPALGSVMQGTGGLRKMRFSPPGWHVGKSGALRIGYVYVEECRTIGLVVVFSKKDKANLTPDERHLVKQLVERFKEIIRQNVPKAGS